MKIQILAILLVLAGTAFAGCALDSYREACSSCSFDENGKIDQSCQQGYQASGTTCVSTRYPIMSGKYAAGECPGVDACAAELKTCTAGVSTGNDRTDCSEGQVGTCYASADACVQEAARKCGEIEAQCPGSSAGLILLLAGALFVARK